MGKSFAINVVARHADAIFTKVGNDPRMPNVLILGPTGMAASLIGENHNLI